MEGSECFLEKAEQSSAKVEIEEGGALERW